MVKNKRKELMRDPVCGMWIEPEYAAAEEVYKDKIFYFCSNSCKELFNTYPDKYFKTSENKNQPEK